MPARDDLTYRYHYDPTFRGVAEYVRRYAIQHVPPGWQANDMNALLETTAAILNIARDPAIPAPQPGESYGPLRVAIADALSIDARDATVRAENVVRAVVKLFDGLDGGVHTVEFSDDTPDATWTLTHPLACRFIEGGLAACPLTARVGSRRPHFPPKSPTVWRVELDGDATIWRQAAAGE